MSSWLTRTGTSVSECLDLLAGDAALAAHDPGDPNNAANWPRYATLFPHAVHSRAVECQAPETIRLIENLVRWLLVAGNADTARTLAQQALTAHEARETPDVIGGTRPSVDTAEATGDEADALDRAAIESGTD